MYPQGRENYFLAKLIEEYILLIELNIQEYFEFSQLISDANLHLERAKKELKYRKMEEGKGAICVTGGTGYIASWLIKKLLEEGYSVHTTIRVDPENKKDISFLTSLPRSTERLKIFAADLSDLDSFDAAIEGCKGVLHLATPVDFENKESEEVLTKRSINGALGIMKACLKSKTVKRLVYTSSLSAVVFNDKGVEMMDESFWTDAAFARDKLDPSLSSYVISKTLTERAALEFGTEHGLDVVTVIPSFVVGPFICPKFPGAVRLSLAPVLGNRDEYSLLLNVEMVHVDDLSRAFIFLLEHPEAKGRYNCSSDRVTIQKIVEILSANYPEFTLPTADSLAEIEGTKMPSLSSKKLLDSGFKFNYGVVDMFDGAIKLRGPSASGYKKKVKIEKQPGLSSKKLLDADFEQMFNEWCCKGKRLSLVSRITISNLLLATRYHQPVKRGIVILLFELTPPSKVHVDNEGPPEPREEEG
ncbi:NAD-dependent epimerase/dehydratase - like 8 [Theobroma cacao]|nr:NAD-dependent epimerase/dehydratase - like 8 [Theobroma cacao]